MGVALASGAVARLVPHGLHTVPVDIGIALLGMAFLPILTGTTAFAIIVGGAVGFLAGFSTIIRIDNRVGQAGFTGIAAMVALSCCAIPCAAAAVLGTDLVTKRWTRATLSTRIAWLLITLVLACVIQAGVYVPWN
jgi:hypothetical protein